VAAALAVVALVSGLLVWAPWEPPTTPTGLSVTASTPTTIALQWASRSTGTPVGRYLILRDKVEVGSVTAPTTSFVDSGLRPGAQHGYQVIAARGSKKSPSQARETVATTAAPAPSDPKRLAVTSSSVTIGWEAPAGSPVPDRYTILVNGQEAATIDGAFPSSTPEYRVTGLSFGTSYRLQVQALWLPDGQSKPSSAVAVVTPYPPVSEARLDGSAGVPVKFTVRATNWVGLPVGKVFTNHWTLTPACPTGPCDVALDGTFHQSGHGEPFRLRLTRAGPVYTGQAKASLSTCRGVANQNSVKVTIMVRAASGPDWTAHQWEGTIDVSSPYLSVGRYYCPTGKTVATISSSQAPAA
jgi:chitodextrinase